MNNKTTKSVIGLLRPTDRGIKESPLSASLALGTFPPMEGKE